MGLANWRPSTAQPLARWVRTALGPSSARRRAASSPARPAGLEPSCSSTCWAAKAAASLMGSWSGLRSRTFRSVMQDYAGKPKQG